MREPDPGRDDVGGGCVGSAAAGAAAAAEAAVIEPGRDCSLVPERVCCCTGGGGGGDCRNSLADGGLDSDSDLDAAPAPGRAPSDPGTAEGEAEEGLDGGGTFRDDRVGARSVAARGLGGRPDAGRWCEGGGGGGTRPTEAGLDPVPDPDPSPEAAACWVAADVGRDVNGHRCGSGAVKAGLLGIEEGGEEGLYFLGSAAATAVVEAAAVAAADIPATLLNGEPASAEGSSLAAALLYGSDGDDVIAGTDGGRATSASTGDAGEPPGCGNDADADAGDGTGAVGGVDGADGTVDGTAGGAATGMSLVLLGLSATEAATPLGGRDMRPPVKGHCGPTAVMPLTPPAAARAFCELAAAVAAAVAARFFCETAGRPNFWRCCSCSCCCCCCCCLSRSSYTQRASSSASLLFGVKMTFCASYRQHVL
jgi:hypothetical protein